MNPFDVDGTTDRVLNSFFLLEPEVQIPCFIMTLSILVAIPAAIVWFRGRKKYEAFREEITWRRKFRNSPNWKYRKPRRSLKNRDVA